MLIEPRRYDAPDVSPLLDAVQAEYARLYNSDAGDQAEIDTSEFDPPLGLFLAGLLDERVVATGGWRRRTAPVLRPNSAEIKRMFVMPEVRGRGLSRLMLAELERTALQAGVRHLVLETGLVQPAAIGLYRTSGYSEVDPTGWGHYADDVHSVYLGKDLG